MTDTSDIQKLCLHLYRIRLQACTPAVAAAALQCLAIMEPFSGAPHPAGVQATLTPDEAFEAQNGRPIYAIKMIRERLQVGLAEAKSMVDEWYLQHTRAKNSPLAT